MTLNGIAGAALSNALADVGTAARRVSQAATPVVESETRLELTTELVRLLRAQRHFEVAVEIARTADETTQTALDLLR
jgi:flagellar basal body rod protein FlgF